MSLEKRINTYGLFLKKKYGRRVFRAGISTGIECPHRVQSGGCIFCLPETYMDTGSKQHHEPFDQLNEIIPKIKKGTGTGADIDGCFLAYFHSGTATAGDPEILKNKCLDALRHRDVCGVVLSTRPDFINEKILVMLKELPADVYLELGVQSIHQKSLQFLKRGHTTADVDKALELCRKYNMRTGVHLIPGIPGEDKTDMMATISYVNSNKIISEVKLHNLVVYKGTPLSEYPPETLEKIPDFKQYIKLLGIIISHLRKDIVISRLFTSNVKGNNKALNPFIYQTKDFIGKRRSLAGSSSQVVENKKVIGGVKRDWMNILSNYLEENNIQQGMRCHC